MTENKADLLEPPTASADASTYQNSRILISCLLLVAATLAFYNPLVHNQFIDFDDGNYIVKNPQIQAGLTWEAVKWSFTTFREGNWHPLTWLSHALDYQLFHLNPVGHHYTNLLLHAINAVLLFLLLRKATGRTWPSLVVGALFALHPINVESVAWAAERKNVLSTLFFLLALLAYTRFARTGRRYLYLSVIAFFALGLMAKPQIVALPFVLLLWDDWPLRRIARRSSTASLSEDCALEDPLENCSPRSFAYLVLEKLPLFLLAALDSFVTMLAQSAGKAVRSVTEVPVSARIENVFISYVRYLGKMVWPSGLAPMYPRPVNGLPLWQVVAAATLLMLISVLVFLWRDRRYLLMGWLWFLGTLIPMIGFITVGEQTMADRYAYIPYIGLFIALVWAADAVASRLQVPVAGRAMIAILVILALGFLTSRQIRHWHDEETLWRYTLRVTDGNYTAHNNLAILLAKRGRTGEAVVEFQAAKSLHKYPAAQVLTLAMYELRMGYPQQAIEDCDSVLRETADRKVESVAWSERGQGQFMLRQYDEAERSYEKALGMNPENDMALIGSGLLALRQGRPDAASDQWTRAAKLDPSPVNFLLLAQALRQAGRIVEAETASVQAKKISPDLSGPQTDAAQILSQAGIVPIQ